MVKKKVLILSFVVIISFLISIICFSIVRYINNIRDIKNFPIFSAWTIEGEYLTLTEKIDSVYTCLFFFSPDCKTCREEIKNIIDISGYYDNVQWIFLTSASYEEVFRFAIEIGLCHFTNITILLLDSQILYLKYRVNTPPAIFLYGPDGKYISRCKNYTGFNRFMNNLNKWCQKE